MKFVKVYFSIILANYFFVFKSCYCLIHYENLLERLVAMFKFFNILIESRYLRVSLPFPTLPLNFWCLGAQADLAGFLEFFSCFFDDMCCFLRQKVHDQPVCSSSVTLLFPSDQNTLHEHLDYAKVTLTHCIPVLLIHAPWKHQKTLRFPDIFRRYR